jgi:hypothetical protein
MSDVMLFGVLRMPYELAMGDELSRRQFYGRAQEAADRIEALEAELADAQEWSGAVAFVTTVQNVVDADGPPWGDEFLAWYKPDRWFGEHRACAVFIGEKMKAAKG